MASAPGLDGALLGDTWLSPPLPPRCGNGRRSPCAPNVCRVLYSKRFSYCDSDVYIQMIDEMMIIAIIA